jgi:hypothetical protein
MAFNMVRLLYHFERVSFMPGLSPTAPLAFFSQATRFLQPIAAGRLAAVLAVLRQLITQRSNLLLKFKNNAYQRRDRYPIK